MANPNGSILPSPNPEHRRVAAGQFERANQVIATGNFDYGIRLLLSCCKLDPANLVFRQALRRTEKAKYRNNLRGSMFAWLTTWPIKARIKAALAARDYLKVLEHSEEVLTRNPWDVGTQMDMAEAADVLGLLDLAIWTLEQARQKAPLNPPLNRALAKLYAKRGNFVQAIALWELVRKVLPRDLEAQHMIKDLAVHHTISRGQYESALGQGPHGDAPDGEEGAEDEEESVEETAEPLPAWWRARPPRSAPVFRPTPPTSTPTCNLPVSIAGPTNWTWPVWCFRKRWGRPAMPSR
jgi:tetratricopeptide (TPR) repeat protein